MIRFVGFTTFALVGLSLLGCGSGGQKGPEKTFPVKGTVKLDGKPMPDGEIAFSTPGNPPKISPIKDGAFTAEAYEGKNRVEISAYKEGPPSTTDPNEKTKINTVDAQFNFESKLTADVTAQGTKEFSFEVRSKR